MRASKPIVTPPHANPHEVAGARHPPPQPVGDLRFRALLADEAWAALPAAVRHRFSKRLAQGETALYRGEVLATQLSLAGRMLAFIARIIGAPLPLENGATGPAIVAVREDARIGGQIWSRSYARPGRFPQVVHSAKRFRGPTGLEEYVGCGVGMTLAVSVEAGALVFRSQRYFFEIGRCRLYLPRVLEPGAMTITHRDEGDGRFAFVLDLEHPRLGRLVHQLARFEDV